MRRQRTERKLSLTSSEVEGIAAIKQAEDAKIR